MRKSIVIIPAFEPSEVLIEMVESLVINGFDKIIVVNDGSSEKYNEVFVNTKKTGAFIVNHASNMGKGAAIKTAICYATGVFGRGYGIITADADGQHLVSDVCKIDEAMEKNPGKLILGTRDFSGESVPFKSRFGNRMTSFVFRITTGKSCPDTQTGLRGIPDDLITLATAVDGSRYEYEMNFLNEASEKCEMVFVPIETVYNDGNKGSHFRPVRDSARVYGRFFRFLLSSLAGAAADLAIFSLLLYMLPKLGIISTASIVIASTVIARCASGIINFVMNKHFAFKKKGRTLQQSLRYTGLFGCQMGASAISVTALSAILPAVFAKIIVDTTLFFASFIIQKRWVFGEKEREVGMEDKRQRPVFRPNKWGVAFSLFLVLYTTYTLLDAFVIPSDVVKVASAQEISESDKKTRHGRNSSGHSGKRHGKRSDSDTSSGGSGSGKHSSDTSDSSSSDTKDSDSTADSGSSSALTDTTYKSDGVSITLTEKRVNDTTVYVADVYLDDPSKLLSGLADDSFGRNVSETTSAIAERVGAVLAINGDYYGFRDSGYVMRNGYLYRSSGSAGNEDLVIYEDGTFEIIDEGDVTAEELESKGAVQIYSFGPGLVIDGEISVREGEEVGQAMQSNPRTAIGMIEKGHYVLVVSDGRTSESEGLTLSELAQVMKDLGCSQAYNLDGGGSTTMVFNGTVVNNPTTNGRSIKERSVSDVIYISGN